MPDFPELQAYLASNAQWADEVTKQGPNFFVESAKAQNPTMLWFGCSDSRVPDALLARKPGEVFVHRNIANQFQPDDDSANAVLEFAVLSLGVRHVTVVGHTNCGGCKAAYGAPPPTTASPSDKAESTALTRFLAPLIQLRHSGLGEDTLDGLIEENVKAAVEAVLDSKAMAAARKMIANGEQKQIYVHGWVYDLASGRLRDLNISTAV